MQTFLEIGLSNALMASVLAVLAAGAGFFCRRPAIRHTLWLLVLLKLVTPPLMSIPVACPWTLETLLADGKRSSPQSWPAGSERDTLRNASPYILACHEDKDLIL